MKDTLGWIVAAVVVVLVAALVLIAHLLTYAFDVPHQRIGRAA